MHQPFYFFPAKTFYIKGLDKLMVTLDNKGIKLFVVAALNNISFECLLLFFCLFMLCSASVIALQIVFSNSSYERTAKWETCQIFKEERLLVHI
jgi:hypothetical protein